MVYLHLRGPCIPLARILNPKSSTYTIQRFQDTTENKAHHRTRLVTSKRLSHPSVLRRTRQKQPVKQRGKPKSLDRRRNLQRCKELEQRASHIHVQPHTPPLPPHPYTLLFPPPTSVRFTETEDGIKERNVGPNELSVNLAGQIPSDDLRLALPSW